MHKIRNVDFSISLDLDMTKHTNSVLCSCRSRIQKRGLGRFVTE